MTILIVEDEPYTSTVLAIVLENKGYPVASVTNGLEALIYLQQQITLPRLILLDLSMPVMDGWEFCEAQQRDPALARIPVIVVSALLNGHKDVASIRAQDYVDKPLVLDTLLDKVARYYH